MKESSEKGRLAEFFRTEYRMLLGYVRRRIDDIAAQDAEDFVHDVAVQLFDRADVAFPIEHLSAYVYQALRNRIADYFRRRTSMLSLERHSLDQEALDFAGKSEQGDYHSHSEIRQMEIRHDLERYMDGLNEEEKKLVIATEIRGQTFSYLSKLWDVPLNTLLSRKARALAKIRRRIQTEKQKKEPNA
jgi:RNA polymerase sigma-70 factor (ECF subfamily)